VLTILNYEKNTNENLVELLNKEGIEFNLSMEESLICKSDFLILPDFTDFKKVIRKLYLSNISNLLRIINKPVLGINNGMILYCDAICEDKYPGLGIINLNTFNTFPKEHGNFIVTNVSNSFLLAGLETEASFYFDNVYFVERNEFTTAQAKKNDITISAILEKDNFFGVQFNPELSGKNGYSVIKNYLKL